MPSRPPPPENDLKGGENEDPEAAVTRSNFESLAKGLFGVSREDLKRAEDRDRKRAGRSKPAGERRGQ
jgi:hypothetical protein